MDNNEIHGTSRILIAEDDKQLSKLFYKTFRHAGYDADIASSAERAWEKLSLTSYALLVLDLGLPGLSGKDLVSLIEQADHLFELRIIVVSGNHQAEQIISSNRVNLTLIKPVSPRQLVSLTERFLVRR